MSWKGSSRGDNSDRKSINSPAQILDFVLWEMDAPSGMPSETNSCVTWCSCDLAGSPKNKESMRDPKPAVAEEVDDGASWV